MLFFDIVIFFLFYHSVHFIFSSFIFREFYFCCKQKMFYFCV